MCLLLFLQVKMDKPKRKTDWKTIIKWAGTVITVGLFIWLLTRMNWKQAWIILREMPFYIYILSILLIFSGQILNSLRWYILLKAQDVPINFKQTFQIFLGGAFASNFLPSTIGGDSLRFLAIGRITKDQPLGLASVILDRVINVLATCTLIPFSISVLNFTGLQINNDLFAFAGLSLKDGKITQWFKRIVKKYGDLFKRWFKKPLSLIKAFIVAWLSTMVVLVGIWVLARGIGMPVTLWQVVGVNTVSYFITLLPISISGYGLREITLTSLYTLLGATLEQATALALITRIFSTLVTLPGVIWMQQIIADSKTDQRSNA